MIQAQFEAQGAVLDAYEILETDIESMAQSLGNQMGPPGLIKKAFADLFKGRLTNKNTRGMKRDRSNIRLPFPTR